MTSLDSLGEAPSRPLVNGFRGYLEKKAGGKAFDKKKRLYESWTKRWFVLPPGKTLLSYYKTEQIHMEGGKPLGNIELSGATVYRSSVSKSDRVRFTVRTSARELRLRAANEDSYGSWMEALQPITEFREDDELASMVAFSLRDDLDDDDEEDAYEDPRDSTRAASASYVGVGGMARINHPCLVSGLAPPDGSSPGGLPPPLPLAPSFGFGVPGVGVPEGRSLEGMPGMRGYLEKKSGGKSDGKSKWKLRGENWKKRWFILPPESSMLRYHKNESEALEGKKAALGEMDCLKATVFLKTVNKGGVHRFTVRTAQRELKLRAKKADFDVWIAALRPLASSFEEDLEEESMRSRGDTLDSLNAQPAYDDSSSD